MPTVFYLNLTNKSWTADFVGIWEMSRLYLAEIRKACYLKTPRLSISMKYQWELFPMIKIIVLAEEDNTATTFLGRQQV